MSIAALPAAWVFDRDLAAAFPYRFGRPIKPSGGAIIPPPRHPSYLRRSRRPRHGSAAQAISLRQRLPVRAERPAAPAHRSNQYERTVPMTTATLTRTV